jgi:hypothetical protein
MVLNMNKTKELVFDRPSPNKYLSPVPLCDIKLVRGARILGVYFSDTLSMECHVNYILKICAQRSYLLKLLSKQGLSALHLHTVFYALIMSRLLYAVPSFFNLLSGSHIERIDSFLKRMYRYGYSNKLFVSRDIVNNIDATLFEKNVVIQHFMPLQQELTLHCGTVRGKFKVYRHMVYVYADFKHWSSVKLTNYLLVQVF